MVLKGAVPQPPDWLWIWRLCRSQVSLTKTSQISLTEDFISSSRVEDLKEVHKAAVGAMADILAEAMRVGKRQALARAHTVALTLDDKQPHRCLMYKSSGTAGGKHESSAGMLALLKPAQARETPASAGAALPIL